MNTDSEEVLCVPASQLDDTCPAAEHPSTRIQGFTSDFKKIHKVFNLNDVNFRFVPRSQCEADPTLKQVITYSIIQNGVSLRDMLFFSYTRGLSGGESKLHSKLSLGIGGHINNQHNKFVDRDFSGYKGSKWMAFFRSEARREIDEEVRYSSKLPFIGLAGMINDDSNPVGQVHLGLVYVMRLSSIDVLPNEDSISECSMQTISQITRDRHLYESWSQIIIDHIESIARRVIMSD